MKYLLLALKRRSSFLPYSLILPAFLVVFALAIYSCYWLIRMSLTKWTFGMPMENAVWVGLDHYRWLLFDQNSDFWESIRITAIYVVSTVGIELIIGFFLALLFSKCIGRSLYTAILMIPIVLTPSMVGLFWRLYFSYDGLVNFFVETVFRTKLNWYSIGLALPAVILVDIWEWTPFYVLILLAGLQTLPREPYEAAVVDGASSWQILGYLTLPMLAPLILTATILRLMDVLRIFDVVYTMFAGGPGSATNTLPLFIYRTTMISRNVGRGSATSIMLIIIISSLTLLLIQLIERIRRTQEG